MDPSYITAMALAAHSAHQHQDIERIALAITHLKRIDEAMVRTQHGCDGLHHHMPQYFEQAQAAFAPIAAARFALQMVDRLEGQGGMLRIMGPDTASEVVRTYYLCHWQDVVQHV